MVRGDVDIFSKSLAKAPTRHQAVNLSGTVPGTISQDFQTTPGNWYTVTWKHTRDTWPACAFTPDQPYEVSVINVVVNRYQPQGEPGDWRTPPSITFQATDYTHTLQFASVISPPSVCGALVTDVDVRRTGGSIPEPPEPRSTP